MPFLDKDEAKTFELGYKKSTSSLSDEEKEELERRQREKAAMERRAKNVQRG